jgi:hypothetical protein
MSHEEMSIFLKVTVSVIYMYMCPIPNGFRDRALSLYSSKTADKRYYVLFIIYYIIHIIYLYLLFK